LEMRDRNNPIVMEQVTDTAVEALALATAAHPNDRGRFVHYVPREKVARIYAN